MKIGDRVVDADGGKGSIYEISGDKLSIRITYDFSIEWANDLWWSLGEITFLTKTKSHICGLVCKCNAREAVSL